MGRNCKRRFLTAYYFVQGLYIWQVKLNRSCKIADKEKGKVSYKIMIDFDEEIKKFKPSLEVEDAEDAIYNNDVPDITDLINKIVEDLSDK